jgi:outer membrane lipoprotein LolB
VPGVARRAWARVLVPAVACAIGACATVPSAPPVALLDRDTPFTVEGRIAAKHAGEGLVARFAWRHEPPDDAIELATPLGTTMATLEASPRGARATLSDGRVFEDADADRLAARTLGLPLPVSGLAWWLRAAPRPGVEHAIERDARGRVAVLRQGGWAIVYAYPDDDARRPSRLDARFPDLEVRIAIEAWGADRAP